MSASIQCDYCGKEYLKVASGTDRQPPTIGISQFGRVADLCGPECRAAFLIRVEIESVRFAERHI